MPSPSPDFSSQTAHLADWMYRRPGSTLRAAKQALQVNTSISPAEVFRHLEILERQNDGPLVVQQRYFDACEAALGLMEALDEALLRPDVRLTGRLVQGHWNQSAEIRLRVHAPAEEVRPVLEHLAFDPRSETMSTRVGLCTAWIDDQSPPMIRVISVPPPARKFANESLVGGTTVPLDLDEVRRRCLKHRRGS
ncbi:MAG: hypothetical protein VX155_03995 [Planctomycetota bacterium]|nr:hypothetical protein [Planctomycetota bacterium]